MFLLLCGIVIGYSLANLINMAIEWAQPDKGTHKLSSKPAKHLNEDGTVILRKHNKDFHIEIRHK